MPRRVESNGDNFTLEIFKGAACSQTFKYENPDGTATPITGFIFTLSLIDVFDTPFKISTAGPTTTLGSFISITDAAQGEFSFTISDEETLNANIGAGRWAIQLDTGNGLPFIIGRDSVFVDEI